MVQVLVLVEKAHQNTMSMCKGMGSVNTVYSNNKGGFMKKFAVSLVCMFLFSTLIFSQEKSAPQTKFDQFLSSTGKIIRFEDFNLSKIKTDYDIIDSKVRKFSVGSDTKYFYQLSFEAKYGTKTASIEYSDLVEILKAVEVLITNAANDKISATDYLESKFVTDGFEIGYYISESELKWYMDLEKYGSEGVVFLSDISLIKQAMISGQEKIEKLKPSVQKTKNK